MGVSDLTHVIMFLPIIHVIQNDSTNRILVTYFVLQNLDRAFFPFDFSAAITNNQFLLCDPRYIPCKNKRPPQTFDENTYISIKLFLPFTCHQLYDGTKRIGDLLR